MKLSPRLLPLLLASASLAGAGQMDWLYHLEGPDSLVEVSRLDLEFEVHHPQGLEKVGNRFFLSTVEMKEWPETRPDGTRTAGKGRGHLLVFNTHGEQLEDIRLGEGARYHPGGISSDGNRLWIPVAEYRPDSHTIVYTVNLDTMRRRRAFDFDDHLGVIAADPNRRLLHAWSWDGRVRYTLSFTGRLLEKRREVNGFVGYQDAKILPDGNVLASGSLTGPVKKALPGVPDEAGVGALSVLTPRGHLAKLLPVSATTVQGRVLTHNTMAFEMTEGGPRLHFAPDDARTAVYTLAPRGAAVDVGLKPGRRSMR